MLTEDLDLPTDGSWIAVVPIDGNLIISNTSSRECWIRFGALSDSYGIPFKVDGTIIVDETVYVRPKRYKEHRTWTIRVTR